MMKMARNSVEGSVLTLSQPAATTDLDGLRWAAATAAPTATAAVVNAAAASRLNQSATDVVNLQYIDLEEFLMENTMAHQQEEAKAHPADSPMHQHISSSSPSPNSATPTTTAATPLGASSPSQRHYQINLEPRLQATPTSAATPLFDLATPIVSSPSPTPSHCSDATPTSTSQSQEDMFLANQMQPSFVPQQQQQFLQQQQQQLLQRCQSASPPHHEQQLQQLPQLPQQQQQQQLLIQQQQHLLQSPHQVQVSDPSVHQPTTTTELKLPPIRSISRTTSGSEQHTAVKSALSPVSSSSTCASPPHQVRRLSYNESDYSASSPLSATPLLSPMDTPTEMGEIKPRKPVKRSRKESVPPENKDDKYWKRRAKNNEAAKRSRDLRREKENEIMHRVTALERDNQILIEQMKAVRRESEELKQRLSKYEVV